MNYLQGRTYLEMCEDILLDIERSIENKKVDLARLEARESKGSIGDIRASEIKSQIILLEEMSYKYKTGLF